MREIRGSRMAMIFQDPMRSLNPVLTIGRQITEVLRRHQKLDGAAARRRAIELLEMVGIPMAEKRLAAYPHQFSGGMRQRVMIAIALSCNPRLLIADEATTALDVTIQAQIVDLVKRLHARARHVGDLDQPRSRRRRRPLRPGERHVCRPRRRDIGPIRDLFHRPSHGYTLGLMGSTPRVDGVGARRLTPIEGLPPNLIDPIPLCPFLPRCRVSVAACRRDRPSARHFGAGPLGACLPISRPILGTMSRLARSRGPRRPLHGRPGAPAR